MHETHRFLEDPGSTREEIMRATYLALCEHGYAGLTIERIGSEFPKSKSLIYHHYDDKDDLLLDFLEFVLERFEDDVSLEDGDGAAAHLERLLDHLLASPLHAQRREFNKAMVELRAQAAHDEAFRDQFSRHDRFFRQRLAGLIQDGIEEGVFRDVEPETVAAMLVATVNGAMAARVTTENDPAPIVRDAVDTYIAERLRTDQE